jgi:hypothetical protein
MGRREEQKKFRYITPDIFAELLQWSTTRNISHFRMFCSLLHCYLSQAALSNKKKKHISNCTQKLNLKKSSIFWNITPCCLLKVESSLCLQSAFTLVSWLV